MLIPTKILPVENNSETLRLPDPSGTIVLPDLSSLKREVS